MKLIRLIKIYLNEIFSMQLFIDASNDRKYNSLIPEQLTSKLN